MYGRDFGRVVEVVSQSELWFLTDRVIVREITEWQEGTEWRKQGVRSKESNVLDYIITWNGVL